MHVLHWLPGPPSQCLSLPSPLGSQDRRGGITEGGEGWAGGHGKGMGPGTFSVTSCCSATSGARKNELEVPKRNPKPAELSFQPRKLVVDVGPQPRVSHACLYPPLAGGGLNSTAPSSATSTESGHR